MSVASDSRPPEAVESGGLPISNNNETTAVPPSSIQYEMVKTIADEVSAQEAKVVADAADTGSPAKVRTIWLS